MQIIKIKCKQEDHEEKLKTHQYFAIKWNGYPKKLPIDQWITGLKKKLGAWWGILGWIKEDLIYSVKLVVYWMKKKKGRI